VRTGDGERLNDIVWLHASGAPMEDGQWTEEGARVLGMYLNGDGIPGRDATGNPITDDHFLIYFNAGEEAVDVTLPAEEYAAAWAAVVDTAADAGAREPLAPGSTMVLEEQSLVVLQQYAEPPAEPDTSVAASLGALEDSGTPA
jgi:glycogen operon protein